MTTTLCITAGPAASTAAGSARARRPVATLILALAAVAVWLIPGVTPAAELTRDTALSEPWRLLTCHLTHFDLAHLAWDLLAFLILGIFVERRSPAVFFLTVAISGGAISLAVLLLEPGIATYRGLSGIDSALYAAAATSVLTAGARSRDRLATLMGTALLLALAAKIVLEYRGLEMFVSSALFAPVPLAHLVGLMIGIGVAGGLAMMRRPRRLGLTRPAARGQDVP